MFKNYLKIAWRNILKNKVYSFINIAGLGIGIAASLLILQYVFFEKSYENFHVNKERIFRLTQDRYDKGVLINQWAAGAFAAGNSFAEEIPEILDYVKIYPDDEGAVIDVNGNPVKFDQVYFASESFFKIFTYPFLHGNPETALIDPGKIVVSESTSKLLFGRTNSIGETVYIDGDDPYQIGGIYKDMPVNTQLHPDIIIPFSRFLQFAPSASSNWVWDGCLAYLLLQENADPAVVEAKFPPIVEEGVGDMMRQFNSSVEYHLQPLLDIHLNSNLLSEPALNGDGKTVNLLIGVSFFILLIAWINYINLATARAIGRAREVGVRKAVGSNRKQLIYQFFFESGVFNFLAFGLAMAIMALVLPAFNQISGQDMSYNLFTKSNFWAGLGGLFVFSMFFSGLYPAIVLSGFKPVDVLKGKLNATTKGALLRKSLVVVQFAASLFLLIGSFVVYQQIQYMRSQSLGIDIEQTIVIEQPIVTDSTFTSKKTAFENAMNQNPKIKSVSTSSVMPGENGGHNAGGIRLTSEDESQQKQYKFLRVDQKFCTQFGLKVVAGRAFSEERDHSVGTVMFNRKGVTKLGFNNPDEAIGKQIEFWGDQYEVIGVVEDFHQISLKDAFEPMILVLVPEINGHIAIKASTDDIARTVAFTKAKWDQFFPGNTFEYAFLDESFDKQYNAEKRFGKVFGIFTILAIIVACLGLFGLASFTTLQRKREIGIRKVLGASVPNILRLLFKEYTVLLGVAFLFAVPFAFMMVKNWLQGYAFRIDLHWSFFLMPFIGIVLIAFITVSFQAIKAAVSNPVNSLRTE